MFLALIDLKNAFSRQFWAYSLLNFEPFQEKGFLKYCWLKPLSHVAQFTDIMKKLFLNSFHVGNS